MNVEFILNEVRHIRAGEPTDQFALIIDAHFRERLENASNIFYRVPNYIER